MQKQINPPASTKNKNSKKNGNQTKESVANQNTKRKLYRKVPEMIKGSKCGACCKSMWIKQLWNKVILPIQL